MPDDDIALGTVPSTKWFSINVRTYIWLHCFADSFYQITRLFFGGTSSTRERVGMGIIS